MAAFGHHPTGCDCKVCNPDPEIAQLVERIQELEAAELEVQMADAESNTVNDKWREAADKLEAAEAENTRLLTIIATVKSVGFTTHPSWNCSMEFSNGWNECRKQVEQALRSK